MKCPHCEETLVMTERSGVEIDYCPSCRGIWLDRGELGKIIAQSAQQAMPPNTMPQNDDRPQYRDDRAYQQQYKRKKKSSFLDELFDF